MTFKSTAAGTALIALMAMGAIFAASASAEFESEAETTFYTTSSNAMQKFAPTKEGAAVECTQINLAGAPTLLKVNTTVAIQFTLTGCENFLGTGTAIGMNGCKFVFHLASLSTTGTTDVECETGKVIEVIVGSICKYTIGTQTGLSSVSFKNTGSGTTREIVVEPNLTGITSTRTTNDFFCPAAGNTGTYRGNFTLTGEDASFSKHVGVFVD